MKNNETSSDSGLLSVHNDIYNFSKKSDAGEERRPSQPEQHRTDEREGSAPAAGRVPHDQAPDGKFFLQAIETAAQPFCSAYQDGRLKIHNPAFHALIGYSADELQSRKWPDLIPPELRDRDAGILADLRRLNKPQFCETEYVRKDGNRVPVEALVHRVFDHEGKDFYYCWFIRDITERKRIERELQKANEKFSCYVAELEQRNKETGLFNEMVSLLQACVTLDELQCVMGKLARELFATDAGALYLHNPVRKLHEPFTIWGEDRQGDQGLNAWECWSLRLGKMYLSDGGMQEVPCTHVKQPLRTASLCIPLIAREETLGLLHLMFNPGWLSLPRDARERQKHHKQRLAVALAENLALSLANFRLRDSLYVQSIHDYLTGMYNRRYMAELLDKELRRMARKKSSAGILIIDIDRFKGFNDRFGHEAGDLVLREFSTFVRKNIREEDFACRYGGDEFVIILPETSLESARQRAEQLRAGVKQLTIRFRDATLDQVTLSLGVAAYPNHGLTAEALLRTADAALYRAKADGRDRVVSL
jgi:diguanylate cyclase (GGDEF)-like protein/PAS domain S-box-containing protein